MKRLVIIVALLSLCMPAHAEDHTYPKLAPVAKQRIAAESRAYLTETYDQLRYKKLAFREIDYSFWPELNQEGLICRFDVIDGDSAYTPATHTNIVGVSIAPQGDWSKSMAYRRWSTVVTNTAYGSGTGNYPRLAPVTCDAIATNAIQLILEKSPELSSHDLVLKKIEYSFSQSLWSEPCKPTERLQVVYETKEPYKTTETPKMTVPWHQTFTVYPESVDSKGDLQKAKMDKSSITKPRFKKNKLPKTSNN